MVASIMRAPRNAGASVGRTPRPGPARRQARRSPRRWAPPARASGTAAVRSARRRRRRCAYRHRASGPHQLGRPPSRPWQESWRVRASSLAGPEEEGAGRLRDDDEAEQAAKRHAHQLEKTGAAHNLLRWPIAQGPVPLGPRRVLRLHWPVPERKPERWRDRGQICPKELGTPHPVSSGPACDPRARRACGAGSLLRSGTL
jgi:hypothetical protein